MAGNELVVALRDLQDGPVYIERDIGLPQLGKRLEYCEYEAVPVSAKVKLKLEFCGGGVLLKGTALAQIRSQCSKCLSDTIIDVNSTLSAYLTQRPEQLEAPGEQELTPEDLEKEWFEGDTLSLEPIVFDAFMLEMPMNPKCSSACPGLSTSRPHKNTKDIDPRLAPLANLKLEKER